MPVLNVELKGSCDNAKKELLVKELTLKMNELFNIPLDKIVVLIKENDLSNWGQAGVTATDPEYETLSRKTNL